MTGWPSAWITRPIPRPIATKKKAKRRADRSSMKCEMKSQAEPMSAKAAPTLARWKTAISGRRRMPAKGPRKIQNMNKHPQAQPRPRRAPDPTPGDLRGAGDAVLEPDRPLDHRISEPAGAPPHLDLKRVPLRQHVVQPHVSEQIPRIAPEPGRAIAGPQTEEHAAVEVGAPGQQPAMVRPTFDRASRYVAGADLQPARTARRRHAPHDAAREMRAVGVHLHGALRPIGKPNAECILVGTAEAKLARTVQHPHPLLGGGEPIRELPGAVGRGVVHDQDVVPQPPDPVNDPLEVLDFVEGRPHHEPPIRHCLAPPPA